MPLGAYPPADGRAGVPAKLVGAPNLLGLLRCWREVYVADREAVVRARTVWGLPAVPVSGSTPRHYDHYHAPELYLHPLRLRVDAGADIYFAASAARRAVTAHCSRCGATVAEKRETLPYVGPGQYIVELRDVRSVRCNNCGAGHLQIPELRALDVLIRALSREQPERTPRLGFQNGRWRVVAWSEDADASSGEAVWTDGVILVSAASLLVRPRLWLSGVDARSTPA